MWVFFVLLVLMFISGGLLILFKTAKMPKLPKGFKRRQYDGDDSSGW